MIMIFVKILVIAIIAYTWSTILTEQGMVFNGLWHWCKNHLPEWLFDPIINCPWCVSGQLALWYFVFISLESVIPAAVNFYIHLVIRGIAFIFLTIFAIDTILQLKTKTQ